MQEIEFTVPTKDLDQAEAVIESVCAAHGLQAGMKSQLASFPGSIHWHYKKPREKGTLELTLFRRDRRIWAQVQEGRLAPWISTVLPLVRSAIERELRNSLQ
jgi:hypothetical protein